MPKGLFSQGAVVLLERPVSMGEVERALKRFRRLAIRTHDEPGWMGPSVELVLAMRPEVSGKVVVAAFDESWPDGMGDPEDSPELFGAWTLGYFGPFAFPGNLTRAAEHACVWPEAVAACGRHRAFIRVLCSYVLDGGNEAPVLPASYDPILELRYLTDICRALLELPQALCYFNPNGETVYSKALLDETVRFFVTRESLPIPVWTSVRVYRLDVAVPEAANWVLMDTVGLGQLDLPDFEACFRKGAFDAGQVALWLRNLTSYAIERGDVIESGHAVDGPTRIHWEALRFEDGLAPPPRTTVRLFPRDGASLPEELLRVSS